MYYDVFASNYCYYDGFSWIHVTVLPSLPMFYGFDPFGAYIVVLNHTVTYNPWLNNTYYTQQYPAGYYQTMYSPRTSLGSNTTLRAYDENQSRPVFVDKRSNKEVSVKYDIVKSPRSSAQGNSISRNNAAIDPSTRNSMNGPVKGNSRNEMSNTVSQPARSSSIQKQNRDNVMDNRTPGYRNNAPSIENAKPNATIHDNRKNQNDGRGNAGSQSFGQSKPVAAGRPGYQLRNEIPQGDIQRQKGKSR